MNRFIDKTERDALALALLRFENSLSDCVARNGVTLATRLESSSLLAANAVYLTALRDECRSLRSKLQSAQDICDRSENLLKAIGE